MSQSNLSGIINGSDGNPLVLGSVTFQLMNCGGPPTYGQASYTFPLDSNGCLSGAVEINADTGCPGNSYYHVTASDSAGVVNWTRDYQVAGPVFDLSAAVPLSTLPDPPLPPTPPVVFVTPVGGGGGGGGGISGSVDPGYMPIATAPNTLRNGPIDYGITVSDGLTVLSAGTGGTFIVDTGGGGVSLIDQSDVLAGGVDVISQQGGVSIINAGGFGYVSIQNGGTSGTAITDTGGGGITIFDDQAGGGPGVLLKGSSGMTLSTSNDYSGVTDGPITIVAGTNLQLATAGTNLQLATDPTIGPNASISLVNSGSGTGALGLSNTQTGGTQIIDTGGGGITLWDDQAGGGPGVLIEGSSGIHISTSNDDTGVTDGPIVLVAGTYLYLGTDPTTNPNASIGLNNTGSGDGALRLSNTQTGGTHIDDFGGGGIGISATSGASGISVVNGGTGGTSITDSGGGGIGLLASSGNSGIVFSNTGTLGTYMEDSGGGGIVIGDTSPDGSFVYLGSVAGNVGISVDSGTGVIALTNSGSGPIVLSAASGGIVLDPTGLGGSSPGNVFFNGLLVHGTIYRAAGTPLPAAATNLTGARAFVSDATANIYGMAYAGGGTINAPVYCDGVNWCMG